MTAIGVTCKQPGRLHGESRPRTFLTVASNDASGIIRTRPPPKTYPCALAVRAKPCGAPTKNLPEQVRRRSAPIQFSNSVIESHGRWATDTKTFKEAYAKDLSGISNRDKNGYLSYYCQPGSAGREEAFAETFAQMHGTGSSREGMVNKFPNMAKEIQHYIDTGRVRRS
jgi:hypothetical protein